MRTQTKDSATTPPQLKMRIELGRQWLTGEELARLVPGSVIELRSPSGGDADVFAGGQLAARGGLVAIEGVLGVKVTRRMA